MLTIYIGPNGYGKTTYLNNTRDKLIKSGTHENKFVFLESEILLLDEVKDTKDNTKTMEYILTEIFSTKEITEARENFETLVDQSVENNQANLNNIVDDILSINEMTRTKDFVKPTDSSKKAYKNLVKIEASDIKNKMGSGQRMQLLLELLKTSTKTHIFIDEPEKYSHPSLLNRTAKLLNELSKDKEVWIATHSPKLISMLDVDLANIHVLNDNTYQPKQLSFEEVTKDLSKEMHVANMPDKSKTYYYAESLKTNIVNLHYRDFIESIFSKKVYLCEGINDQIYVNRKLIIEGNQFEDYYIFKSFGKFHLPVFAEIFKRLDIDVFVLFDIDDESKTIHENANEYIKSNFDHKFFDKNIEDHLDFKKKKESLPDFVKHIEELEKTYFM